MAVKLPALKYKVTALVVGTLLCLLGLHYRQRPTEPAAAVAGSRVVLTSRVTLGRKPLLETDPTTTLRLYTEELTYFDDCGFKHQPEPVEVSAGPWATGGWGTALLRWQQVWGFRSLGYRLRRPTLLPCAMPVAHCALPASYLLGKPWKL